MSLLLLLSTVVFKRVRENVEAINIVSNQMTQNFYAHAFSHYFSDFLLHAIGKILIIRFLTFERAGSAAAAAVTTVATIKKIQHFCISFCVYVKTSIMSKRKEILNSEHHEVRGNVSGARTSMEKNLSKII